MTAVSMMMGHEIIFVEDRNAWCYSDTGESIDTNRQCIGCKMFKSKEGHDPCIALLPNIKHACCGHGKENGYIMTNERLTLRFEGGDSNLIKNVSEQLASLDYNTLSILINYTNSLNPSDRITISTNQGEYTVRFGFPFSEIRGDSLVALLTKVAQKVDKA